MNICINGESLELSEPTSIDDLITKWTSRTLPFSLAINGEFVPRSSYEEITLKEGDEVDIVSPIGGG